jgi:hypothetical protein
MLFEQNKGRRGEYAVVLWVWVLDKKDGYLSQREWRNGGR